MADVKVTEDVLAGVSKLFKKPVESLSLDTEFVTDLKAKSLDMFGLAAVLAKMSGKEITYADVNQCKTIGDAVALIEKLLG